MSAHQHLSQEERHFFKTVTNAIFANPFSVGTREISAVPGTEVPEEIPPGMHAFEVVTPIVNARVQQLASRGLTGLGNTTGADRELLEHVFLYLVFDSFREDMDALIRAQLLAPAQSLPVPYATRMVAELSRVGFTEDEVPRYVALLFQLRRAYYFIAEALVGDSAPMRTLRHALWNNVFTSDVRRYARHLLERMDDFSLLLLGETGTGKGAAAAAIGRAGFIPYESNKRRFATSFASTFHAFNLSEFPESLIESELFGHRKGAFTGAIEQHDGMLAQCGRYGALLLDEIGDVSVPVQIKLLNVLQARRYARVGEHVPQRFEGRVIAATNRDLNALMREGRFREDFFYRLSSDVITLPLLRERISAEPRELEQLTQAIIERLTGAADLALIEQVLSALRRDLPRDYAWPGNVRELEQAVRRILISGSYRGRTADESTTEPWLVRAQRADLTADELLGAYCQMLYRRFGTIEEVARRTALDRRTAKKYLTSREHP